MDTSLKTDIKFNCDVSDAKFWGYFSICGLLMRYRDLFRSENSLKPWSNIAQGDIARWIEHKETKWPDLEGREFRDLTVNGRTYHPFDVAGINQALGPQGLVYGAGYGMYLKPTFFLAELKATAEMAGLTIHTAGAEYVRDLFSAPAMLQESSVFLRQEPLAVFLLYKFSGMNAKRDPALEDAFASYGFRHRQLMDDTFGKRLDELAGRYMEIVLCHEIAEFREAVPGWKDVLSAAGDRKNEHYLRAVKDLIADTSECGPLRKVVETKDRGALGLIVAFREGFQRALYPELRVAYTEFLRSGNWDRIEEARTSGYARFLAERERILLLYRESGNDVFGIQLKKMLPV